MNEQRKSNTTTNADSRLSLFFISGKHQGGEFVFADDAEVLVGRTSAADLLLLEGMVSRLHARLTVRDGRLWVEDLGSTNGTFVNGTRVRTIHQLREGDRVLIGTSIMRVQMTESPVGSSVPRPDSDALIDLFDAESSDFSMVTGKLEATSVAELLEQLSTADQEAVLTVSTAEGTGTVTVKAGMIEALEVDTLPNAPVLKRLFRLLGWTAGDFLIQAYEPPPEKALSLPITEALVDGLFKVDELNVLRSTLGGRVVDLVLERPLRAPLRELDDADLDLLEIAHNLGRLDRILDETPETDLVAVQRLLRMLERGYLRRY